MSKPYYKEWRKSKMLSIKSILDDVCITEEGAEATPTEVVETQSTNDVPPQEFEIDGEKLTVDQIKQFRSGYENYTKTVNEYKSFQEKAKEAQELYDYLKGNEELAKKLYEYDLELQGKSNLQEKMPTKEKEEIYELKTQLEMMKIEKQIENYKAKDKDFDEASVVKLAVDNNLTIDLAYKLWKADRYEGDMQKALKDQSKNLTEQIAKNGQVTKTLITEGDKNNESNHGLSQAEVTMAEKLGLSVEEYAKWKQ